MKKIFLAVLMVSAVSAFAGGDKLVTKNDCRQKSKAVRKLTMAGDATAFRVKVHAFAAEIEKVCLESVDKGETTAELDKRISEISFYSI